MPYISQYSGEQLDANITINNDQNNRLTNIETNLANLNNTITTVLNSELQPIKTNINNLLDSLETLKLEFTNLKPMLRIILRLVTTALSATMTCNNGTLISNSNGIWEWEVPTYGNYVITFNENGKNTTYNFEVKYFGINEYKLNYTYQMQVTDFIGNFKNCSENCSGNLYADTAGFTITGTNTTNKPTGMHRIDYKYDLTYVKEIRFAAKKNANHGNIGLWISDGVKDSGMVYYYSNMINYGNLGTSWAEYIVNTANISGEKIISFIGGYTDSSGNSSSSTSFADIRFIY